MRLILVRHGESEFDVKSGPEGVNDSSLTRRGQEQAERVAEHFANESIDAVYSSTLARAKQTALPIAQKHSLSVTYDARIVETDFGSGGSYKGCLGMRAVVEAAKDAGFDPFTYSGHGGESPAAVISRARPFFDELIRKHKGETVIVVAHGSLIRLMVHTFLRLSRSDLLAVAYHPNAAYTILDIKENGSWRAHVIAAKDHLE
jgi:broad specificity phosphatase PhoE